MIFSEKCTTSVAIIVWIISAHLTHYAVSINCDLEPKNNVGKLKKFLLCKYDKTVHPSVSNDPVTVTLKMIVKGFTFDEHDKVLLISSWLSKSWQDDNLKWTPAEYNGITHFVESSSELWQPDLQLFNSDIASVHNDECRDFNCDISSSGHVACIPPCVHSARCAPDFARWPFDSLNCTLHIGTWLNSADEVDFKLKQMIIPEADLQSQDKSWKMIRASYQRIHGNFSGSSKTYPSVLFTFLLDRHSGAHAVAFLVPALIMAIINLLTLWMSPETTHRLILLAFNILSHFIYMQQMSWQVPFNGDICPTIEDLSGSKNIFVVCYVLISGNIILGIQFLCFRDSLIITGFLLVNTILVRGFTSCGLEVPNWVGTATGFMGSNKFGQLFLSKSYLIDRQPLHSESDEAADVNGSEPQTLPTVTIKPPTNTWVLFARYIDRLLFIIVAVLYVCMYFALIPGGYKFSEPRGKIEIVGT